MFSQWITKLSGLDQQSGIPLTINNRYGNSSAQAGKKDDKKRGVNHLHIKYRKRKEIKKAGT
jgi:hypothetical protein